ncbi:hypothetical protein [Chryseobacterium sp. FH1]|uniref:hypothetical protein n=1 Tax=Chryseobacterium sp. FH1 TaxID=1233951 RepID=UPI0004E2D9A2|nr:hypothetical protein [Chryseobacterium sp. FH1]KFC24680.1 hypothetical protein IO90_00785 [Chryseobacterium sp. FH1]
MNFNKTFALVFFLFSIITFSQKKINIIDFDTKKPIPQARVVYNNEISYTNDDGFVIIPNEINSINIYSPEYGDNKFAVTDKIALKPIYKEIEEVIIKPIDARKIIASVLREYDKKYETKTSIFNGTMKFKSEIDNALNRILVIDMDLWTLHNKFEYQKEIDDFLQVNLRNKKFDKNRQGDNTYIFNGKKAGEDKKNINDFIQRFFLYNQLVVMEYFTRGQKISGKIINETGDIQTIQFKSDELPHDVTLVEGLMQYNKKENAIIYLKCSQIQKNTISSYTNYFDKEITTNTSLFTVTYDMYKKGEKYIPAKIIMEIEAEFELENKIYPATNYREFIFRTHNFADKKGLSNKIDLKKPFADGITDNSVKDTKTLLSTEEQKFVDEQ